MLQMHTGYRSAAPPLRTIAKVWVRQLATAALAPDVYLRGRAPIAGKRDAVFAHERLVWMLYNACRCVARRPPKRSISRSSFTSPDAVFRAQLLRVPLHAHHVVRAELVAAAKVRCNVAQHWHTLKLTRKRHAVSGAIAFPQVASATQCG